MRSVLRMQFVFVALLVLSACLSPLAGQMVDPAIDIGGQPFSYPAAPTDVIGIPDAIAATEVTPEGYLYTGYGELMFLVGSPAVPVSQRIRTLHKGYLPIIQYEYRDGEITYHVTAFAAALQSDPARQNPINFVRIVATNNGSATRSGYFNVAFRYTADVTSPQAVTHRFLRPVQPRGPFDIRPRNRMYGLLPCGYYQAGTEFDPGWEYRFTNDLAVRSGQVVYMFPRANQRKLYAKPFRAPVLPSTPVLMAQYKLTLTPGEVRALVFKMPLQPIASEDVQRLAELRAANFDDYLGVTSEWWTHELHRGIQIEVAETKVTDTFLANLAYLMIARDKVHNDYVQTVNKFHYHAFWLRDGAYMVRAYDVAGYHDLARQCLGFFFQFQKPDGNFLIEDVKGENQFDAWGQTFWAFGQHYRFTRDDKLAERALLAARKAVAWLHETRRKDSYHLLPPSNPHDMEFAAAAARITGYNLWALAGLKNMIYLATVRGSKDDLSAFQAEYDDYARTFWKVLEESTSKTDDYIPPGVDQPGGHDWGNLNLLFPEAHLPAFDRKVTRTLETARARYQEGLMTWAGTLHHYLTMKLTENLIVRGEQKKVLDDFYAVLLHTTSTHAGWEFGVKPWGDRDFRDNLAPHGMFGASYISVLRNMLLREQGNDLHLLSVLSPVWTQAGKAITVRNAPSYFGTVGFEARFRETGMTLEFQPRFATKPERIVIHLPFFEKVSAASVDGKATRVNADTLVVPASARKVEVSWQAAGGTGGISYDEAIENYKREYRARYERGLQ